MDTGGRTPKPPRKVRRVSLQKTSGRWCVGGSLLEIADLLDGGADPHKLVDVMRSGKEDNKAELSLLAPYRASTGLGYARLMLYGSPLGGRAEKTWMTKQQQSTSVLEFSILWNIWLREDQDI